MVNYDEIKNEHDHPRPEMVSVQMTITACVEPVFVKTMIEHATAACPTSGVLRIEVMGTAR